ncbi:MAG: hypothetical protein NXY57DRAFT_968185 [Lentinula lateritia]|nr:MAG: hypothetical protein NXY57DRAFT_968185 [Lentinula lateritia]
MRTKTAAVIKRSSSPSGPASPRTYGRHIQGHFRRNHPSQRHTSTSVAVTSTPSRIIDLTLDYEEPIILPALPSSPPSDSRHSLTQRRTSNPVASSSTPSRILDLTLDYEEPIVLPALPSSPPSDSGYSLTQRRTSTPAASSSTPSRILDLTLDCEEPIVLSALSSSPRSGSAYYWLTHKVKKVTSEKSDNEPMFIPTVNTELSMTRDSAQSSEKVSQNEYDALCQAYTDLEKSLENARTNIKALEDAIEAWHFTPIPNYASQYSVDTMLQSKGIEPPSRPPLQWPPLFRSVPVSPDLPFPRRNGTYPVSAAASIPAPFPVVIDNEYDG